jgi:hypothetical protein
MQKNDRCGQKRRKFHDVPEMNGESIAADGWSPRRALRAWSQGRSNRFDRRQQSCLPSACERRPSAARPQFRLGEVAAHRRHAAMAVAMMFSFGTKRITAAIVCATPFGISTVSLATPITPACTIKAWD